jgi:hypothetical protein
MDSPARTTHTLSVTATAVPASGFVTWADGAAAEVVRGETRRARWGDGPFFVVVDYLNGHLRVSRPDGQGELVQPARCFVPVEKAPCDA